MREIAVLSGKGGTGKTSLVAAFAHLAGSGVVLADCDVDAANLSLLLPGPDVVEEPFFAGLRARINENLCCSCASCVVACRFGALSLTDNPVPKVSDLDCEGCRACSVVCPEGAIKYVSNRAGTLYLRKTEVGPLIHAALGIAEDNSGKLVAWVRERSKAIAKEQAFSTVLIDGPPGIGCPVHATLGGVNLVVAVTEPTPSGLHDLERLLDLCLHFKLSAVVVVNKYDLVERSMTQFETVVKDKKARLIGGIPFHLDVPLALAEGKNPLSVPEVASAIEQIWNQIERC